MKSKGTKKHGTTVFGLFLVFYANVALH